MKPYKIAKSLLLLSLALITTEPTIAAASTDTLLAAVSDVGAYRTKVEECVRDLKASLQIGTPQYLEARAEYQRTKHAYDLFLQNLAAATSSVSRQDSLASAQRAQRSSEHFIQYHDAIAQHDRGLLAAIPPFVELVAALFDLRGSPSQKNDTVDTISQQVLWKSWDRIR